MRPTKTIGEIFGDVKIGGTPARERAEYFGGGIPWVSIKDMGKGKYVSKTNETLSESGVQNSNVKLIKKGSLLFSFKLTVGRMCFAGTDLYTNEAIAAFEPNPEIMLEYLYYILPVATKQVKRTNNFGAPLLNKDQIKKLQIPLPPLETQKAIVAKLDQIFAELDQTKSEIQKNLDNTDELRKSALNQAFQGDWEIKKLGEVIKLVSGQDLTTKEYNSSGNGIPYITGASNIENESIIINRWTEFPKSIAKEGDLLITVKGTVGTMAVLHEPKVHIARQIMAIQNEEATTIFYIKLFLETYIQKLKNSANGLIPGISRDVILNIQIPVPPLSEQEKIVEHLDQVSKEVKALKSQYQSQLDNLEELKKSVLDKAFRGEIGE